MNNPPLLVGVQTEKNMRKGSVVIHTRTKREGMVVWKKNNQEIGVNFGHYQMLKNVHKVPLHRMLERLNGLGLDDIFSKEELEFTGEICKRL